MFHVSPRIMDEEWSVASPNMLVTINTANQVELWDLQSRSNPVQSFTPDHEAIAVYPSPHDNLLMCQGRTLLSLYDLKTLSVVGRAHFEPHCFAASWDSLGHHFLTVHTDGVAKLWGMDDLSAPKSTITLASLTKTISPEQSVRL